MAQLKLIGGYYQARSLIANAQRCVNLYPEKNPEDAPFPYTQYPTPGLTKLYQANGSIWRGLYFTSTGILIGVLDNQVFKINPDYSTTLLGTITSRTTPVSIFENGFTAVIGDGVGGWSLDLTSLAFGPVVDPTGSFVGTTGVDYIDTFFLFNQPGSRNFYSSLSNSLDFDPLFIAAKTGQPDLLQRVVVVHREFLLIGVRTTEVWYDAGNANFPFAIVPGVFIEQGTQAPWSPAKHDLQVCWLTQARDGERSVVMYSDYAVKAVTTFAVANQLQQYSGVTDAVGFSYKQADHVFYVLNFPTANKTWVFDMNEGLWHERSSIDPVSGQENRWRVNCAVLAYNGDLVGGDYQNGKLYRLDPANPLEDATPIVRRRGLPHITNEGKYLVHDRLRLDIETGTASPVGPTTNVFNPSLMFSATGYAGFTLRQVLPPTDFSFNGTSAFVRVRFSFGAGTSSDAVIVAAAIGPQGAPNPWNTPAGQVQLTFNGGNNSLVLAGGAQIVQSDLIPFSALWNGSMVVSLYVTGTTVNLSYDHAPANTGVGPAPWKKLASGNDALGTGDTNGTHYASQGIVLGGHAGVSGIDLISVTSVPTQAVYGQVLTTNNPGWKGFTLRQVLLPSEFQFGGNGAKVQVKIQIGSPTSGASTGSTAFILGAGIGPQGGANPWNTTSQVALTFNGGSASYTLGAGDQTVLTDFVTFPNSWSGPMVLAIAFGGTPGDVISLVTDGVVDGPGTSQCFELAGNDSSGNGAGGYADTGLAHIAVAGIVVTVTQAEENWWPLFGFTAGDQVQLRWSDDRGRSWRQDPRLMPLGAQGQTYTYPQWTQLGTARDRVYELLWTSTGQVALNGAYADVTPGSD